MRFSTVLLFLMVMFCHTRRRWRFETEFSVSNVASGVRDVTASRSEEHTSELQSQSNLVCRLLLEKKNLSFLPARPCRIPPCADLRHIRLRCRLPLPRAGGTAPFMSPARTLGRVRFLDP